MYFPAIWVGPYNKIIILKCTSAYPAPTEELNLKTIKDIAKKFKVHVGFSDHSIGNIAALTAVALGAKIIEKHFTLDKSSTIIRDHSLSATPEEFRQMVNIGRDIFKKINMGV